MQNDPLVIPTITAQVKTVGLIETPVVTVTIDPTEPNVGDEVSVSVNVKRADNTTPIAGLKVDFFVQDGLGTSPLGDRQETDANGNASASASYWVGVPEAGQGITFYVVTRPKLIPT